MSSILVTGAAGFIGSHLAVALARQGHAVVECDRFQGAAQSATLASLQRGRVAMLLAPAGVRCERLDLCEPAAVERLVARERIDVVIHLAAEAGVRRSAEVPLDFVDSNLNGFGRLLEACRLNGVEALMYASSSSVYGARPPGRFAESDPTDTPCSLYAATKIANEAMARAYHAQFGLRCIGMRFFTVYGPWGRPDMAAWNFARNVRLGRAISLYGQGLLRRDFTPVTDVVDAVSRLLPVVLAGTSHEVVNIGHCQPVTVRTFVRAIERAIGRRAVIEYAPRPAGDVDYTCADETRLTSLIGSWQHTPIDQGVDAFVRWLAAWEAEHEAMTGMPH